MKLNELKKCTANINDKDIIFYHSNPNDIVGLFIELLTKEDSQFHIIEDNKIIQIGWNFFVIKKAENKYQIFAVDYTNNPFKDVTDDLTLSLNILKEQLLMVKKTGMVSDDTTSFQDTVLVRKTALNSKNLYFLRQDNKNGKYSGWYMGDLNDSESSDNTNDYQNIYEYELLSLCPKAISIMNLPIGTLAVIADNEIVSIVDADNNELYK